MVEELTGWLWALPLFMLWFVPAQWVKTKERQWVIALEKAEGDPEKAKFWMGFDSYGRGFWLFVIAGWALTGGIATWLAAYFVRNSPVFIAVPLGLFLIGTAWSTGWRNVAALVWLRGGGRPA